MSLGWTRFPRPMKNDVIFFLKRACRPVNSESDIVQEAIFEAIENQMRDNNPPITRETFNRLVADGYSRNEAMKLIGYALANEISEIMNSNQSFSEERYSQNLRNLPDLPWDE